MEKQPDSLPSLDKAGNNAFEIKSEKLAEKKSMLGSRIESQYTRNSTFGLDIEVDTED